MDCTAQIQHWFYLCLALCGVILAMLAMFFGYNLKLGWRTAKLEKKNGKEMKRIEELEKKNGREQKQFDELKQEIDQLKEKGENHE